MGEVMLSNSIPPGGNTGDVLTKNSGQNYDVTWKEPGTPTTPTGGGIPSGGIIIWSGTVDNIPDGWKLCDGQDGSPDLRDKFILGAGTTYSVGETGGAEKVSLTAAQLPSHSHIMTMAMDGNSQHIHTNLQYVSTGADTVTNTTNISTTTAGNSQPHNNMPPYYTLCYIMKL